MQPNDRVQAAYEAERRRCLAGECVTAPRLALRVGRPWGAFGWRVIVLEAEPAPWTGGRTDHEQRLCRVVNGLLFGTGSSAGGALAHCRIEEPGPAESDVRHLAGSAGPGEADHSGSGSVEGMRSRRKPADGTKGRLRRRRRVRRYRNRRASVGGAP